MSPSEFSVHGVCTPTARLLLLLSVAASLPAIESVTPTLTEAVAFIGPNAANVAGTVRFSKGLNCTVVVTVQLTGLRPGASQGFHIHELGNLSAGCDSTGTHWNPTSQQHGMPNSSMSHAGDLGNAVADAAGNATFTVSNPTLSRFGLAQLYGRTIIVHNLTDDLGLGGVPASLTTGNAGARIACAIIGRSSATVPLVDGECPGWTAASPTVGLATITSPGVSGSVRFSTDVSGTILVDGSLKGLRPNAQLGFHVHEFGDLSDGCQTTGAHWNPTNGTHGAANSQASHAGDLGNVQSDDSGSSTIAVSNPVMTAQGLPALIGRTVVVHNLTDDLGLGNNNASKLNGNAGARIGCAIIGIAASSSPAITTPSSTGSSRSPTGGAAAVSGGPAAAAALVLLSALFRQ